MLFRSMINNNKTYFRPWETIVESNPQGILDRREAMTLPPLLIMVALETDDVDAEWKRLQGVGVEFIEKPTDSGQLRIATLRDPEGNLVQLLQPIRG